MGPFRLPVHLVKQTRKKHNKKQQKQQIISPVPTVMLNNYILIEFLLFYAVSAIFQSNKGRSYVQFLTLKFIYKY